MFEKYNFRFNEEIAKIFDEHVKESVPMYDEFQENISNMSVYFSQLNTNIVDVGTSTGTLIKKIYDRNMHRNVKCLGIDIEQAMINECKKRYTNINFELKDALEQDFDNSSVVTCMLSLQFMRKDERKDVLKKIYQGLNEDGALFVVEKIKSNIPDIHDMYNDIYYDFKRRKIDDESILDKNASLRGVMKPITLDENISNLQQVGFKKIETFMKYNNFVGILAVK